MFWLLGLVREGRGVQSQIFTKFSAPMETRRLCKANGDVRLLLYRDLKGVN